MAKGKRTVALFEVIHKDKRMEARPPAATGQAPGPANESSRTLAAQAVNLWKQKRADPETLTGPPPAPVVRRKSNFWPNVKARWVERIAQAAGFGRRMRTFADQQMGALIGGGSAVVVISAMILARHYSNRGAQNLSTEQQLLNGPAHPAVLAVTQSQAVPSAASPELAADVVQAKAGANAAAVPTIDPVAQPGARIVNMHYVLIQSYGDQATAKEARDFLEKNGVACTIERGIKGWRMDFYQVIGLRGFAHLRTAEYSDYREKLKTLDKDFSGNNPRSYKHFQPQPIKW